MPVHSLWGSTPAWDAFWFVVPWEAHRRFGDRRALEKTYPSMKLYLDEWIPRWTPRDGDPDNLTLTSGLGDWDAPEGVPTSNALASTAYYAHLSRTAGGLEYDITVPPNSAARIHLPASDPDQITEKGGGEGSARFVGVKGDRVVYEAGSGSYRFRIRN